MVSQPSRIWKAQCDWLVERDKIQTPLKMHEWEAGPKQSVGISGISQRMASCLLSKTKTVGDDLRSTNTDNDDYQWLPAEFVNQSGFGNVC